MDKNSPVMTSDEIIDAAAEIYELMYADEKYSTGEVIMILDAAKMMMVERQILNVLGEKKCQKK